MSVWTQAGFGSIGIYGGILASLIIIGPTWFMNHYLNLVDNKSESAFVDQGLAIGVCGIMRDTFMKGTDALASSFPTIGLVIIGAVLGGITAALFERNADRNKTAVSYKDKAKQNNIIKTSLSSLTGMVKNVVPKANN
ncbi:hypothetical protein M0J71_RS00195 [Citrobacter freundii]|nr:hypothetical protein [Citrobacter freundii]